MGKYVFKRLLWIIPTMLCVAILIFAIMHITPGNPAEIILGAGATPQEIENFNNALGLNDPFLVQLGRYLRDVFLHFDFGNSYISGLPVTTELMNRFPYTFGLAMISILLGLVFGIPLGIGAALNHNKLGDRICMIIALIGISMPDFWIGLLLVIAFALKLGWLPALGIGGIRYWILPCITACFGATASNARQMRSSMLEVIRSDYITTALAKGMSRKDIVLKHALPNAIIPVLTVSGVGFGSRLGGAVVVESVFSIPGIGSYLVTAVGNRDYPAVMGSVIILCVAFSLVVLLVDIGYAFVDPRIKAQYENASKKRRKVNG